MSGLRGIDVNLSAGASRKKHLMNNIHGAIPSRHEQHATDNTATNISSHIKNFLIIFSWSSSSFTSPTPSSFDVSCFIYSVYSRFISSENFFSLSLAFTALSGVRLKLLLRLGFDHGWLMNVEWCECLRWTFSFTRLEKLSLNRIVKECLMEFFASAFSAWPHKFRPRQNWNPPEQTTVNWTLWTAENRILGYVNMESLKMLKYSSCMKRTASCLKSLFLELSCWIFY